MASHDQLPATLFSREICHERVVRTDRMTDRNTEAFPHITAVCKLPKKLPLSEKGSYVYI